jgi:hypothetical protein
MLTLLNTSAASIYWSSASTALTSPWLPISFVRRQFGAQQLSAQRRFDRRCLKLRREVTHLIILSSELVLQEFAEK